MYIRDVNSYIAVYTNGKIKRKGAYQYEDLGWHQNHSALVIPKKAAKLLCYMVKILLNLYWSILKIPDNKWDFMLRTKVPRSSQLYTCQG